MNLRELATGMDMVTRKTPPDATRTSIMAYALLTGLVTLLLFASLAFLRYGTG